MLPDKRLHFLIVDDDEIDRMALRRVLGKTNFEADIDEAQDAQEALTAIAQRHYDCIFLDYNLPGKNGLELTQHIRFQGLKVPIIVLTGQGDEQIAVSLMKAGASDYLTKYKLSSQEISRLVRSALKVFQAELQAEQAQRDLQEKNALLEQINQRLEQQSRHIYRQHLQLQEVSRLKSAFLATMSHELRTPLNAIIGFSQLLINQAKGPLNQKQTTMLKSILNNGRNLLELINDILSFSKIEANRLVLDPVRTNLPQRINGTLEELKSLAEQKNISLEADIVLQDPWVVNDTVRFRQILVNLLSNAIKFTSQGSVRVIVRDFTEKSDQNDEILISVVDTGCGMSPKDYEHIFTPFFQADQRTNRKHAGTGLGLAITYSLVQMMNGKIKVESQIKAGTTFTVTLPREVHPDRESPSIEQFIKTDAAVMDSMSVE